MNLEKLHYSKKFKIVIHCGHIYTYNKAGIEKMMIFKKKFTKHNNIKIHHKNITKKHFDMVDVYIKKYLNKSDFNVPKLPPIAYSPELIFSKVDLDIFRSIILQKDKGVIVHDVSILADISSTLGLNNLKKKMCILMGCYVMMEVFPVKIKKMLERARDS